MLAEKLNETITSTILPQRHDGHKNQAFKGSCVECSLNFHFVHTLSPTPKSRDDINEILQWIVCNDQIPNNTRLRGTGGK